MKYGDLRWVLNSPAPGVTCGVPTGYSDDMTQQYLRRAFGPPFYSFLIGSAALLMVAACVPAEPKPDSTDAGEPAVLDGGEPDAVASPGELPLADGVRGVSETLEEGAAVSVGEDLHGRMQPGPRAMTAEGPYAVVSRDPIASRIGFEVLERGGNAADAAAAIAFAISVSEPHFSHALGGGTWALYYEAESEQVYAVDGVGPAGQNIDIEFFRDPQKNTGYGVHRTIVPGAWDGWMLWLDRFGTEELDSLLQPVIDLAEQGVPASRSMRGFIVQEQARIASMPHTAEVFLPEGRPPALGSLIYQPNLGGTLRELRDAYRSARDGSSEDVQSARIAGLQAARDYYYRGPIAERLTAFLQSKGGFLVPEDFAAFEAELREPISTEYRGVTVYQAPPNSQGISMLMALNILEGYDLSSLGPDSGEAVHYIIEATKLGKIDVYHYVGDPSFVDVPVETLLSEEHARAQRERIDPLHALEWPAEGGIAVAADSNTTSFVVYDSWGNAASVTTSTGAQFLVGGETGIMLNQRMANMEIAAANPNMIAPGKKVRHTVNAYLATRDGRPYIFGANTGYDTQPQGKIQQFVNVVDFGMTPQEAVARRRYITHAFPASTYPHLATNELYLERGFPPELEKDLVARGHTVGTSGIIGNANMIMVDHDTAQLQLGADPRGENLGLLGWPAGALDGVPREEGHTNE